MPRWIAWCLKHYFRRQLRSIEAKHQTQGTWKLSIELIADLSKITGWVLYCLPVRIVNSVYLCSTTYDCVEDIVIDLNDAIEAIDAHKTVPEQPSHIDRTIRYVFLEEYLIDREERIVDPILVVRTLGIYAQKLSEVMVEIPNERQNYYRRAITNAVVSSYGLMEALLGAALN